ncbi:hypothetical protein FGG08_006946 [Glutinoglossum americanum]|uniref:Cns1/TTC4 wheel domain-containing protein n=1 Tax=Glutinoglossum americanum TaxID=1670608 RepID=A0A9P8I6B6_9PEZI|nr:hypothetical protein FGG08_006946 [Glutinoglossum americanum]
MSEAAGPPRESDERLGVNGDGSSRVLRSTRTADSKERGREAQLPTPATPQVPTTPPSSSGDEPLTTTSTAPAMPPHMIPYATQPPSEILSTISQTPLFMTSLSPTDAEPNPGLEALQALAYEGPPSEIAQNFREQGNECFRAKRWKDAKEFYGKALRVLEEARRKREKGEGAEEEVRKEREIEEICLVNRAACNLELQNYRQTTLDATRALTLNPTNIKAHYRLSLAHYNLNHLPAALSTLQTALTLSPPTPPLQSLHQKILTAQSAQSTKETARLARLAAQKAALQRLQSALRDRNIATRRSAAGTASVPVPDLDAKISLDDDAGVLYFPTLVLYPLAWQSDFISALGDDGALGPRLAEMLPPPWDEAGEYTPEGVECYMETVAGGLVKVGKKVPIGKVLGSGKVEVVDEVVKILVVPREKAAGWVEEFKEGKRGYG